MESVYDLIVIGGGPGGYTAALYGARAGMKVLVLERLAAGGQMALTHEIDNYPGFDQGIDGFELGQKMRQGAERFGAETAYVTVDTVELSGEVKAVHTDSGSFYASTVVLSTGANPRKLGLPKEEMLTGRGVHYCAACDGMFYRGKTVVLVGGGNSAAADVLELSRVAKKVILVHRRDTLRADKASAAALSKAENLEILWNSKVTELLAGDRFQGVVVENVKTGQQKQLSCDGLFISIGREPVTDYLRGQVTLAEGGYILADETTRTSVPGVFAVGDVRTKAVRQIVTAAADGAVAVHFAEEYLSQKK